jgi:hypothetical protein
MSAWMVTTLLRTRSKPLKAPTLVTVLPVHVTRPVAAMPG